MGTAKLYEEIAELLLSRFSDGTEDIDFLNLLKSLDAKYPTRFKRLEKASRDRASDVRLVNETLSLMAIISRDNEIIHEKYKHEKNKVDKFRNEVSELKNFIKRFHAQSNISLQKENEGLRRDLERAQKSIEALKSLRS